MKVVLKWNSVLECVRCVFVVELFIEFLPSPWNFHLLCSCGNCRAICAPSFVLFSLHEENSGLLVVMVSENSSPLPTVICIVLWKTENKGFDVFIWVFYMEEHSDPAIISILRLWVISLKIAECFGEWVCNSEFSSSALHCSGQYFFLKNIFKFIEHRKCFSTEICSRK